MQIQHTIKSSVCHPLSLLCLFSFSTLPLSCACIVSCSRSVWFTACLTCSRRSYLHKCLLPKSQSLFEEAASQRMPSTPFFVFFYHQTCKFHLCQKLLSNPLTLVDFCQAPQTALFICVINTDWGLMQVISPVHVSLS